MAATAKTSSIEITPIESTRDLKRFIRLPHDIYAGRDEWRAPLHIERRMHLSQKHNPAFEHLDWRAWLAWIDGRAVGRITAQVDRLRETEHGDRVGYFGMLEAIDDARVFAGLLTTAETWLTERGMTAVHGPFNLTINDECGLLIEGLDTPPMMMMGHGREYYAPYVEAEGYDKAVDMLAYWIDLAFEHPRPMRRLLERYRSRIHIRPIERSRYTEELDTLRDIFNDAWADNWGFVPFTEAEFRDMGNTLKLLIADDLVQIAEVNGKPAAFIVGLPNLNEAARDLNGRLSPIGIGKLLWRLKVRFPRTARVPLMGVRQQYQDGPLGAALAFGVIAAMQKSLRAHGATGCELSWILEDNKGMRDIIERLGAHAYKTYRIYRKTL
ncbi:N-acetyltransferase [Salinisphaera sp.]|uniref:N-acetyltransferase n=1 Tax=Salinisphaera sp. TaxID=1914330 RepID=UPI002D794187|nr:N-acetyltransferase [Salinisphaera sp.]HET7313153.1 N-acetyltransferase [Salinisphaera sp.]